MQLALKQYKIIFCHYMSYETVTAKYTQISNTKYFNIWLLDETEELLDNFFVNPRLFEGNYSRQWNSKKSFAMDQNCYHFKGYKTLITMYTQAVTTNYAISAFTVA